MATELAGTIDRVMPDGSVSYFMLSRSTRYDYTAYYIDNINSINYHNFKSLPLFSHAAQVSLKKSMKVYPNETRMALVDEIDGLLHRKVWTGVIKSKLSKAQRRNLIRSSCFIKQKFDSSGNLLKWKARIVSDGSMQDKTLYKTDDISAPTIQLNSLLSLSAIAATENMKIKTMDVAQAYLNADMPTDVFVSFDKSIAQVVCERDPSFKKFLDEHGNLTVKLNKAQYGCVESAKLWYKTLSSFLESIGFTKNKFDPCVFSKVCKDKSLMHVGIYVDDIKAFAKSDSDLNWLQGELEKSFGKLNVVDGDYHDYLGMKFDYSKDNLVTITMEQYIKNILEETETVETAETPATLSLFEVNENSRKLDEPTRKLFHRTVAQLLYAAIRCRPDILLPVIFLTSRVTKATAEDARKLSRVLKYLKGTTSLGITLGADRDGNLRVHSYADASYGVHPDAKSQSGIYISLGRGPIFCKSAKIGRAHV
jgi:hypothetical protein